MTSILNTLLDLFEPLVAIFFVPLEVYIFLIDTGLLFLVCWRLWEKSVEAVSCRHCFLCLYFSPCIFRRLEWIGGTLCLLGFLT